MNPARIAAPVLLILGAACTADDRGLVAPSATPGASAALTPASAGVAGSATGSAHLTVFPPPTPPGLALRNFTFSAVRHVDGSVNGEWQVVAGATIIHGLVDCLTIAPGGHTARMSGLVESVMPVGSSFMENTAFAIELFDNGPGESAELDVATQLAAFRNAAPEVGRAFCETGTTPPDTDLNPLPLEHGNFTIRLGP